jgi:hypothetical protein
MTTKTITKANPHVASDPDVLGELDLSDQAQALAVKRVLVYELERNMRKAQPRRRTCQDGFTRPRCRAIVHVDEMWGQLLVEAATLTLRNIR